MQLNELKKKYDEFYEAHKNEKSSEFHLARNRFLKENVTVLKYVPFEAKTALVLSIAEDLLEEDNGLLKYNQIEFNVIKMMSMVNLYTDIEYDIRDSEASDEENEGKYEPVEAYDVMKEMGVDDLFYNDDALEFNEMLTCQVCDEVANYNSVGAVLNRRLGAIEDAIVGAVNKLGEMNLDPKMLDEVSKTIESINGTVNDVRQFSVLKGGSDEVQV